MDGVHSGGFLLLTLVKGFFSSSVAIEDITRALLSKGSCDIWQGGTLSSALKVGFFKETISETLLGAIPAH